MSRPRLLDLYCCQGGASRGYADAGFEVVGVDIDPQRRYPYEFHQADAIAYVLEHGHEFDVIHASPPCQRYSLTQRIRDNEHPDLIGPTRDAILTTGKPYVIENVVEAAPELLDPVMLCGSMFGLRTYRHRLFESNVLIWPPEHPAHTVKSTKMGRPVRDGENMHVVGNFVGVDLGREVMQMPWANRDGLREAIPPAYSRYIGGQLMAALEHELANSKKGTNA